MTNTRRRSGSSKSRTSSCSPSSEALEDVEAQTGAMGGGIGPAQQPAEVVERAPAAAESERSRSSDVVLEEIQTSIHLDDASTPTPTLGSGQMSRGNSMLSVLNDAWVDQAFCTGTDANGLVTTPRVSSGGRSGSQSVAQHVEHAASAGAPNSLDAGPARPDDEMQMLNTVESVNVDQAPTAGIESDVRLHKSSSPVADVVKADAGRLADRISSGDTRDGWTYCSTGVWEREKGNVKRFQDEIRNLLTFAGLFSAALTAFNVQYYLFLQPQTPDEMTQILLLMSAQLGIIAANAGYTDITQPMLAQLAASSKPTRTSAHVISINTLWFSALVFSLSAASIAISVSQWLHHHVDGANATSQQGVRIWYFRHRAALKWQIPFIISLLPILLQTSLALFLIGLLELLWTLNHIVAGIVTALVTLLLMASMVTALLPTFFTDCPYKSQPAWWCFVVLRSLFAHIHIPSHLSPSSMKVFRDWVAKNINITSWREFEQYLVQRTADNSQDSHRATEAHNDESETPAEAEEPKSDTSGVADDEMLAEADATILDDMFLANAVRPCLVQMHLEPAVRSFRRLLQRRAHDPAAPDDPSELTWSIDIHGAPALTAMANICADMLDRISRWPDFGKHIDDATKSYFILFATMSNLLDVLPSTDADVCKRYCEMLIDIPASPNPEVQDPLTLLLVLTRILYHRSNASETDNKRSGLHQWLSKWDGQGAITLGYLSLDILSRTRIAGRDRESRFDPVDIVRAMGSLLDVMPRHRADTSGVYKRLLETEATDNVSGSLAVAAALRSIICKFAFSFGNLDTNTRRVHHIVQALLDEGHLNAIVLPTLDLSYRRWMDDFDQSRLTPAAAVMAEVVMMIFPRITPDTVESEDERKKHQGHIVDLLQKLVPIMPKEEFAVYGHFIGLLGLPDISDEIRNQIAHLISLSDDGFSLSSANTQKLLACIPTVHAHLSTERFLDISQTALKMCKELPRSDFDKVRDVAQGMLALFVDYFSPSHVESAALALINGGNSHLFYSLLKACVYVARVDDSLFNQQILDAFQRCAWHFRHDYFIQRLFDNLHDTCTLHTTVPLDMEYIPSLGWILNI